MTDIYNRIFLYSGLCGCTLIISIAIILFLIRGSDAHDTVGNLLIYTILPGFLLGLGLVGRMSEPANMTPRAENIVTLKVILIMFASMLLPLIAFVVFSALTS